MTLGCILEDRDVGSILADGILGGIVMWILGGVSGLFRIGVPLWSIAARSVAQLGSWIPLDGGISTDRGGSVGRGGTDGRGRCVAASVDGGLGEFASLGVGSTSVVGCDGSASDVLWCSRSGCVRVQAATL